MTGLLMWKKSKKSCTCAGCLKKGAINTGDLHLYTKGLFYLARDSKVVSSTLRFCPYWKCVQEIKKCSTFSNHDRKKKTLISSWCRGACPFAAWKIYSYRFSSTWFIAKLQSPLFKIILIYRVTLIWVEKLTLTTFFVLRYLKEWDFRVLRLLILIQFWILAKILVSLLRC